MKDYFKFRTQINRIVCWPIQHWPNVSALIEEQIDQIQQNMNGREEYGSIIVYEECSSIPCEVTDKGKANKF